MPLIYLVAEVIKAKPSAESTWDDFLISRWQTTDTALHCPPHWETSLSLVYYLWKLLYPQDLWSRCFQAKRLLVWGAHWKCGKRGGIHISNKGAIPSGLRRSWGPCSTLCPLFSLRSSMSPLAAGTSYPHEWSSHHLEEKLPLTHPSTSSTRLVIVW